MVRLLSARRPRALASATLVALGLVLLCGPGSAVAADRMVIAENFSNTG